MAEQIISFPGLGIEEFSINRIALSIGSLHIYWYGVIIAAAFLAAGQGEEISMKHLLRAAVNEMKKNGIVVVREQLQEYADLLEEA